MHAYSCTPYDCWCCITFGAILFSFHAQRQTACECEVSSLLCFCLQFYVKFNMRQYIGDILEYCWTLPPHQDAWRAFAAVQGGRGPYLHFANMLINDSIYLLDESLKKLKVC